MQVGIYRNTTYVYYIYRVNKTQFGLKNNYM